MKNNVVFLIINFNYKMNVSINDYKFLELRITSYCVFVPLGNRIHTDLLEVEVDLKVINNY